MNILKSLFHLKAQGADFIKDWDAKPGMPTVKRTAQLAGVGAGAGAVVGLATGGIAAGVAINNVPVQTVTVDHFEPVTQRETIGYIPQDKYKWTSWRPWDDGVPTEPVNVNNPVYDGKGDPSIRKTSTTFSGHGTPRPVEWRTENITDKRINTKNPYDYWTIEDTETYLDHYESVLKTRQVPSYDTEYFVDCSSGTCKTESRTVTNYRTETYTEQEPVYRTRTVGYWQKYSPNINSKVVGSVQKPNVTFDHGVNVGSYLLKGVLLGAGLGALAGGMTAALEEKYFPNKLPGYEPKPSLEKEAVA